MNGTSGSPIPSIDSLDDIEGAMDCLERLAQGHAPSSSVGRALAIAGHAVLHAYSDAVRARFTEFVTEHDLTPKQREHLKAMGIDVPGERP